MKKLDVQKSDYKGVYFDRQIGDSLNSHNNQKRWRAQIMYKGNKKSSVHHTEREAAIAYDKMCLNFGLPAVNILKKQL